MKKELIGVIMQALYGNRTYMELDEKELDRVLQGCLTDRISLDYKIDRTIVEIPDSPCVIVYNKFQEEEMLKQVERWKEEEDYIATPLAIVKEKKIEIYSRCFMCRRNENNELCSILEEDSNLIMKYLKP